MFGVCLLYFVEELSLFVRLLWNKDKVSYTGPCVLSEEIKEPGKSRTNT
jgi:hypothetical protein